MVVFRWIVGSIAALVLLCVIFSYTLGLSFKADVWLERGKRFRQVLWILALFWFNFEVWGRVVWTIVKWNRPG